LAAEVIVGLEVVRFDVQGLELGAIAELECGRGGPPALSAVLLEQVADGGQRGRLALECDGERTTQRFGAVEGEQGFELAGGGGGGLTGDEGAVDEGLALRDLLEQDAGGDSAQRAPLVSANTQMRPVGNT
jgi:hypothetical protein